MADWVKAILIGTVLISAMLLIPVFVALMTPVLIVTAVVIGIWFIIQILKPHDSNK